LNLFAIFHVVLIGSAALFLIVELSRKLGCSICRNRKPPRTVIGDTLPHIDESHVDANVQDQDWSVDSREFDTSDLLAELERRSTGSPSFDEHGRHSAPDAVAPERATEAAPPSSNLERAASPMSPTREMSGTPCMTPSGLSALSFGNASTSRPISHMLRRIQSASAPVVERITHATVQEQDATEVTDRDLQDTTRV